jgi:hypothetical protein
MDTITPADTMPSEGDTPRDRMGDAAAFARKQPTVFFLGAIAAGFALSRFAKSSTKREDNGNV